MVKYQTSLDGVFAALADATRRGILSRLMRSNLAVTELARPFSMSLPAISKHLTVLERAGLLKREKRGRTVRCSIVAAPMKDAVAWINRYQRFWETQLDALTRYVEQHQEEAPCPQPSRRSRSRAASRRRGKKYSAPGPSRRR